MRPRKNTFNRCCHRMRSYNDAIIGDNSSYHTRYHTMGDQAVSLALANESYFHFGQPANGSIYALLSACDNRYGRSVSRLGPVVFYTCLTLKSEVFLLLHSGIDTRYCCCIVRVGLQSRIIQFVCLNEARTIPIPYVYMPRVIRVRYNILASTFSALLDCCCFVVDPGKKKRSARPGTMAVLSESSKHATPAAYKVKI